ncbi:MAG: hypothetical protein GXP08_01450 [Gammaproteobacteria bacterium]|nr:hypothetical protein [Gammaproteobacteria bacterium]
MNEFFANLVGRHLGTCDTIQPRTLGRFEADSSREAVASPQINPLESTVDKSHQPIDLRSTFSVDSPKTTVHEPDPIGNKKDYSLPSLSEQSDTSAQLSLIEQQAALSNSHVLFGKPYDPQPLDADRYFHLGAVQQEQPNNTTQVVYEHDAFSNRHMQTTTNSNESREVSHDKNSASASRADGHNLENELNQRIRAMLQRLAGDPVSPITEPAPDDRDSKKNKSLISLPCEKNASLLNAAVASLDPVPTLQRHAGRQDRTSADDRENTALYGPLETPSWLPDMESQFNISLPSNKKAPLLGAAVASLNTAPTLERQADRQDRNSADNRENTALYGRLEAPTWLRDVESQFNQRLQEKHAKTEPVINVTIGRVEVRAVQADVPKNAQRPKKPTGVMTLDEYLKRREGRGTK